MSMDVGISDVDFANTLILLKIMGGGVSHMCRQTKSRQ